MLRFAPQVSAAIILELLVLSGIAQGEAIQWASDLGAARAAATAQNKLLLLHFWAPDCLPCKKVEQDVFPNPNVAQAINDRYVPLQVDASRNVELREHFRVDRWPTDIIATPEGELIYTMVTPQDPNRYIHELVSVASQRARATGTSSLVAEPVDTHRAQDISQDYASRWSDGAAALGPNDAYARRPGIDYQGDENFAGDRFVSQADAPSGQAIHSPSGTPLDVTEVRQGPQSPIGPRATAGQPRQSQLGQAEITNPYFRAQQVAADLAAPAAAADVAGHETYAGVPSSGSSQEFSRDLPAQPAVADAGSAMDRGDDVTPLDMATPPVGLDGRCPVTLITEGSWKKGDERWGAIHRGRLYFFAGQQQQQAFLASPDKYSPVLAGMDVVRLKEAGKVVQGNRQFGVLFDGDGKGPNPSRIYLFESAETRAKFEATPEKFLRPVMEALQRNALHTMLR